MKAETVIIDYGAGNLTSVKLALDSVGAPAAVTASAARVLKAGRIIFPGVGAAGSAMSTLRKLGLVDAIRTVIHRGTPFLGICVGTQILLDHSEEDGGVECLGIIPGSVKKFRPVDKSAKIPQMGWNRVEFTCRHPVLNGIGNNREFYFLHSYYPSPASADHIIGRTDFAGVVYASFLGKGSCIATQFHPERSGKFGIKLLSNFCAWDGKTAGRK